MVDKKNQGKGNTGQDFGWENASRKKKGPRKKKSKGMYDHCGALIVKEAIRVLLIKSNVRKYMGASNR